MAVERSVPGGGASDGLPLDQEIQWSCNQSVIAGEPIEYTIKLHSSPYMTYALSIFTIRVSLTAPYGGILLPGIGIKGVIVRNWEEVPNDYWTKENSDINEYTFKCVNCIGLYGMWMPSNAANFIITLPTDSNINTETPVTAKINVVARGTSSWNNLTTNEITTNIVPIEPSFMSVSGNIVHTGSNMLVVM